MSYLQLSFADQEVSINRKQTRAEIIPIRPEGPRDSFGGSLWERMPLAWETIQDQPAC